MSRFLFESGSNASNPSRCKCRLIFKESKRFDCAYRWLAKIAGVNEKAERQNRELVMFKDRISLVVIEYVIGFSLLITVLPQIVHPRLGWSDAHSWAYLLFIVCSSFTLLSCASEMKKRLQQTERIEKLEKMVESLSSSQKQTPAQSGQKRTAAEHLVNSVN